MNSRSILKNLVYFVGAILLCLYLFPAQIHAETQELISTIKNLCDTHNELTFKDSYSESLKILETRDISHTVWKPHTFLPLSFWYRNTVLYEINSEYYESNYWAEEQYYLSIPPAKCTSIENLEWLDDIGKKIMSQFVIDYEYINLDQLNKELGSAEKKEKQLDIPLIDYFDRHLGKHVWKYRAKDNIRENILEIYLQWELGNFLIIYNTRSKSIEFIDPGLMETANKRTEDFIAIRTSQEMDLKLTGDRVALRSLASLNGVVIDRIPLGEELKKVSFPENMNQCKKIADNCALLFQKEDTYKNLGYEIGHPNRIGAMKADWALVLRKNRQIGYVYGWFLEPVE